MPDPAPRLPRPDSTSADATSLERMSRLPAQPVPAQWSGLFVEPDFSPEPPPAEERREAEVTRSHNLADLR